MDDLRRVAWREKLSEVHDILEKEGTKRIRGEIIKLSEFLSLVPALTNMCPRSELDVHLIDLSQFVEMVQVNEGEAIFHKGEGSTHFYFVLQGTVAVFIQKSTKEFDLEEKLLGQLAKWQLDLERVESHNAMMVKQQEKMAGKYENELEEAEAFEAIKQGTTAVELLQSQIRQGKISLKEYSCVQDEQLLRGPYESRYFKGEKSSNVCNFKKVEILSESDSFGESVLSSTSQQRTGTVIACPGTNVVLGRIEKHNFLSVFNKELDKRQQIRRALLNSYRNDLNDKVLNTLTFQFREVHLQKNAQIATQGPLFNSEYVAKVEDSPLTKRRSKEQQYLAEKEEHLYFLYKGSLEVQVKSLVNFEDQTIPEIVKKSMNSIDNDNLLKNTNHSLKSSQQTTQLRLTQLSEGEFFGHENWYKEDIEKLLKNSTTEVVQLPEQQFKDKLAQQLYIDFSIVVAEIDTIVFRLPKKYLLEEQNQFLFRSLVTNGKQRHNRYSYLEKQAIVKEQSKLRVFQQQLSPAGALRLTDKPGSQRETQQYSLNKQDIPNRRKLFANSKVDNNAVKDDKVAAGVSQQKVHFKNQFETFRKKFDVEFNFSVSQFSHPVNAVGSTAASLFHNQIQREKQQIQFKRSLKNDLVMPFPSGDLKDQPESSQITSNQIDKDTTKNINMNPKDQSQIKDNQQMASSLNNLDIEENFTDHNFKYPKKSIQPSQYNFQVGLRGKSMHNLDQPIKEQLNLKLKRDSTGSFHQDISSNVRLISPGKNRITFMNSSSQLSRQQQSQQEQDTEGSFQQQLKAQSSIAEEAPTTSENIQRSSEPSQTDLLQDKTAKKQQQKTKLILLKMKKSADKSRDEDISPILIRSISKQSLNSVKDFARVGSPEINRDSSPQKLSSFTQLKSIINLNRVQTADDKDFFTWSQQELQSQEGKRQHPGAHKNGRQQYSSSVHNEQIQNRQTTSFQYDSNYQQQPSILRDECADFQRHNSQNRIDSAQHKQRNKFEDQRVTQIYYPSQNNPSPQLSPTKSQIISKETLSSSANANNSSRKRIISKESTPPGSQQSQKRLHSLIKEPTTNGIFANSSSPVKINKPQIQPSSQPLSPPLKSQRYLFTQGDPSTLFHTFSYQSSQRQQELQQQGSIPDSKFPNKWKQEDSSSSESFQTLRRSLSPVKIRRTQETFKDQLSQQQQYDSARSSSIHFVDSAAGNENISQARFSVYIDKARLSKNNSQDSKIGNNQIPRMQQQQIQHIIHSCFKKR